MSPRVPRQKGILTMNIISEKIKEFESYLKENERTKNTIEKYIRDITAFAEWMKGTEMTNGLNNRYKKSFELVLCQYRKTFNFLCNNFFNFF